MNEYYEDENGVWRNRETGELLKGSWECDGKKGIFVDGKRYIEYSAQNAFVFEAIR